MIKICTEIENNWSFNEWIRRILPVILAVVHGFTCFAYNNKKNKKKNEKEATKWIESSFLLVHNTWKTNKLHTATLCVHSFRFILLSMIDYHTANEQKTAISFIEMSKLKQSEPNMKMIMRIAYCAVHPDASYTHQIHSRIRTRSISVINMFECKINYFAPLWDGNQLSKTSKQFK